MAKDAFLIDDEEDLKHTSLYPPLEWSKVDREKLVILESAVGPSNQFSSYRSALQVALRSPPTILVPFFSLFVKDSYFLIEECSQKLPNGNVNFESFLRLAKQISDFITWNKIKCPYEKKEKILMFLEASTVFNETELFIASYERESPEAEHERENYKIYKSRLS
ncbi:ras-GEF domain-containing family member 1C-like [Lycorma delicatula]|uniref:ras-GEF domain-containing family member 1C-like n=1 Tax=Lycorma delicatula TaxID=130591 RepID=UPI003F518749